MPADRRRSLAYDADPFEQLRRGQPAADEPARWSDLRAIDRDGLLAPLIEVGERVDAVLDRIDAIGVGRGR